MDPISLPEKIACKSQSIPRYSLFRSRESLAQYPVAAHVVSPGFSEAGEPCRRNRRFQTGSWWFSIPSNFSPLKFPPSRTEILREGWGNGLPAGAVGNVRDGRRGASANADAELQRVHKTLVVTQTNPVGHVPPSPPPGDRRRAEWGAELLLPEATRRIDKPAMRYSHRI
jgi:hypothetical protein